MRYVLKRLILGVLLILLAAAILLFSDWNHRVVRSELPRVALFQFSTRPLLDDVVRGVVDGLRAEGFAEGRSITIAKFNAENDLATANAIARSIIDQRFDLVVTASTPCMQVMAGVNQEGKVKHVFCAVTDPFGAGAGIKEDGSHPPHLTGVGTFQPVEQTFRVAKQLYPELKVVGEVWNPAEACSEACTVKARAICQELGIQLVESHVDSSSGVQEAVNSLASRGVQAIWIGGDNTVEIATDTVIAAARKANIPVFSNSPGNAGRGLLFGLGADYYQVGKMAGGVASQVLRGVGTAAIPVKDVMPKRLALNLSALKGLRDPWSVPSAVLASAADLIDENGVPKNQQAQENAPNAVPGRQYKIGLVYFGPDPGTESGIRGLIDGLAALGFVRDKNLEIREVHAQGEIGNISQLIQNFDAQGLNLIVPLSTPCLMGALATAQRTPIVFTVVYDPIAAGAGTSYENHLPKVTGVGSFPPVEETMATIQRLVPGIKVLGTLYNPSEANSVKVVGKAREVTKALGIKLEEVSITSSNEVHQAAQVLVAKGIQAFWITGDNTALQAFAAIGKVAADHRLPLINNDIDFLADGALLSVGIGFYEAGLATADAAARVMNGQSPAGIPMRDVAVIKRGLNYAVARKIGYSFPSELIDSSEVFAHLDDRLGRPARIAWSPLPDRSADKTAREALLSGLRAAGLKQHEDFELLPVIRNASLVPDLAVGFNLNDSTVDRRTRVRLSLQGADPTGEATGSAVRIARILGGGTGSVTSSTSGTPQPASPVTPASPVSRKWNIHFINYVEAPHVEEALVGFFEEFKRLGMVEGRDYSMKMTNAQGDMATLVSLIDGALTDQAELILLTSTPTLQAALHRARKTPVIFTNVGNPILAGAGESFEKHLPNVTGISTMSDFDGMVKVIKECLPGIRTIGTLFVPSEINSVCFKDELAKAAQKGGLKLITVPVFNSSEVPVAASSLVNQGVDAISQISDNLCDAAFSGIAATAQREKKPLFSFVTSLTVKQGAAIAVARDYTQGGRDVATRAVAFMKGTPLSDIPFSTISKTRITINPRNAGLCGLRVPPALLERADQIVR